MQQAERYSVDQLPGTLPFYLKALSRRPGFRDGDELPATRVEWPGFRFDAAAVEAYADLCGSPLVEGRVPLLFPHSFFGPLHLLMLTDRNFPLRVLGGVHLRNHLLQSEPLRLGQDYDAALYFSAQRRRPQGLEVDFRTEIASEGRIVWDSLTTFLFRLKFDQTDADSALAGSLQNIESPQTLTTFEVPRMIGKRFGWITRDLNPIHISGLAARLFGFRRDLCHGMWALGRSLACIPGIDYDRPVRNDVAFKGPLYIGRDVTVKVAPQDSGQYELYSAGNERPCVLASIANVAEASILDRL